MKCYIKDRNTFQTLCACSVVAYDITLESIYDEVSDISILYDGAVKEGDIVWLENGYCGIINGYDPDGNMVKLKCNHIITLFSRDLYYDNGRPTNGIEPYIKSLIDTEYTNQRDTVYRVPYLRVTAETITQAGTIPDVENLVCQIKSYIAKVRRLHDVFMTFTVSRKYLDAKLARKVIPLRQIDFSDQDLRIEPNGETFSETNVGKIRSIAEDTGEIKDWYLLGDGTITNSYTEQNRIKGDWIIIKVNKAEDVADSVKNEFKKNTYSHKILFSVPKEKTRYNFYDDLLIALGNRRFRSYIAAVRIQSSNDRIFYQCGELRTTMTDKLKELI